MKETKVNVNPDITLKAATYFLKVHHDFAVIRNPVTKELTRGLPSGHFYVELMDQGASKSFGFYPEALKDTIIGKGKLEDETIRLKDVREYFNKTGTLLINSKAIALTEKQYASALKFATLQKSKPEAYILGMKDCADFVQNIYHATGLTLYFTKIYSADELREYGSPAAKKVLQKYGSRDTFESIFQCIEGASCEEVANRLNIDVGQVVALPEVTALANPDSFGMATRHFKVELDEFDIFYAEEKKDNIDEYFAYQSKLADSLADNNPFDHITEKEWHDGVKLGAETVKACHTDEIKQSFKDEITNPSFNFSMSEEQIAEGHKFAQEFFTAQMQNPGLTKEEAEDIRTTIFNFPSVEEAKKQLEQEPWFQELIAKTEKIQHAVSVSMEENKESYPGNLDFGINLADFSNLMPDIQGMMGQNQNADNDLNNSSDCKIS